MNLKSLIHARLDGEITAEQHMRLENWLRGDWQARRLYLELADQHARLLQQPQIATGRLPDPRPAATRSLNGKKFLAALVAAAVITLAYIWWPREPAVVEATSDGVAILSETWDARFAPGAHRSGETLAPGALKLVEGLAQIEFFSGATVLIEGGAEIEMLSAWEARCLSGRVRVHVPPAAKGFLMHAPDMKLEDLGTEFALNVEGGSSAVHVYDGEVIAHTSQAPASLRQGMTLGTSEKGFLAIGGLQQMGKQRAARRFEAWQAWSFEARKDPHLIAYYTFKHWEDDRWERLVNNFTLPARPSRAGGAVGARWAQGRWPGKEALEFKRPGDRVRMNLDGSYDALTFTCWVRVDSLDKKYNSLLLTDGYENGEPHWQIYEDGRLMFSLIYRPDGVASGGRQNQIYYSRPVFNADSLGRWHHLAVTYDSESGLVTQYFDGKEAGREVSSLHQPGRLITFGPCELGNWGLPTQGHQFPVRNLNGALDEFAIYSTALSPSAIRQHYEMGKPD